MPVVTRVVTRRSALAFLASAPAFAQEPRDPDSGSLFPVIDSLKPRDYSHSFLHPRWKSVDRHRKAARELVAAALSYSPAKVPLRPETLQREELPGGGVIREKIAFDTAPGVRVPAYLHLPAGSTRKLPAVVDLHSHGGMFLYGKEKVTAFPPDRTSETLAQYHKANYESRPTATELARRGYAVLTIDAFPFGERRYISKQDLALHGYDRDRYSTAVMQDLNLKCRQKESTVVKSLAYAGVTWPGMVLWDDMRSVDYLLTRPEVDPARIGCVGVSLGGYRSLLLSGMDDRIAAGCVVGFLSTVQPMIRTHMDTHSFVHFIPRVHAKLDLPDVVALRAPKPLLVLQCKRDGLFPLAGMEEGISKIEAIYKKARAPKAFESHFFDVPHIFNIAMQEVAFAWLDRRLRNSS